MKNSDGVNIERLNKIDLNTKELDNITTEVEDLDSDDDDDLPAFDMSNDTPVTEDTKVTLGYTSVKIIKKRNISPQVPILYIRDVIHHLSETESSQVCIFCQLGSPLYS